MLFGAAEFAAVIRQHHLPRQIQGTVERQHVVVQHRQPHSFLRWISLTMPLAAGQASFSTDR
ncbi:hypothetical protein A6024_00295 [Rhodovulum sulfidophilum]|nr:hypothetical protein A6W98_00310 [Rhodovulum sulfidophilum DSM 1374]ANB36503.1 hypothetical protein A6024_00295 [Rhodovulum sulfidophilum]